MSKKLFFQFLSLFMGLVFLLTPTASFAANINNPLALLNDSQQMLLLITSSNSSHKGWIQLYQRDGLEEEWQKIGDPISIVVGSKGLAWSVYMPKEYKGPRKKEGDLKTPAGIFKIGPSFGFTNISAIDTKLSYIPVSKTTLCVDDPESHFYNKIVDSKQILMKDWKSAEQMRNYNYYKHGLIIGYNNKKSTQKAGSCIFMHIWKNQNSGTTGCVATDENNLVQLTKWLDPYKRPVLVTLTKQQYQKLYQSWDLPTPEAFFAFTTSTTKKI